MFHNLKFCLALEYFPWDGSLDATAEDGKDTQRLSDLAAATIVAENLLGVLPTKRPPPNVSAQSAFPARRSLGSSKLLHNFCFCCGYM